MQDFDSKKISYKNSSNRSKKVKRNLKMFWKKKTNNVKIHWLSVSEFFVVYSMQMSKVCRLK